VRGRKAAGLLLYLFRGSLFPGHNAFANPGAVTPHAFAIQLPTLAATRSAEHGCRQRIPTGERCALWVAKSAAHRAGSSPSTRPFIHKTFAKQRSTSSGAPESSALRSIAMALRNTVSMCLAARFGVIQASAKVHALSARGFRSTPAAPLAATSVRCRSQRVRFNRCYYGVYALQPSIMLSAQSGAAVVTEPPSCGACRPAAFRARLYAVALEGTVGANLTSLCPIHRRRHIHGTEFSFRCDGDGGVPICPGHDSRAPRHRIATLFS